MRQPEITRLPLFTCVSNRGAVARKIMRILAEISTEIILMWHHETGQPDKQKVNSHFDASVMILAF